MPNFKSQVLTEFICSIFMASGAPQDIASRVANSLVEADLRGHDSHGVQQAPIYVTKIRDGHLDPTARPKVLHQSGSIAQIDCGWGFGQITADFGADLAARLAGKYGLSTVALQRSSHMGRLGEYVEKLASCGCIGMMIASGAPIGGVVAPYGGRERIFGTNPIAWAVPVPPDLPPLVVDFATSAVAAGKLRQALNKGEIVANGLVIDHEGNPSTNPAAFLNGGALLPFGDHKGYGLMLIIEIVANLLAGAVPASLPEYQHLASPALITAWSVEAFMPLNEFLSYVQALLQRIKLSEPALGFDEVLLPGEPEARNLAIRNEKGISLSMGTWQKLLRLAEEFNIPHPTE